MEKIRQIIGLRINSDQITLLKVISALVLTLVFLLSIFREFDRDEFEAIHTAWKLYQGEMIYIDFFQHHHPFFYYSLIPLIKIFGESISTLLVARSLIFLMLVGMIKLTHDLANVSFNNRLINWLSVLLVVSTSMFSQKAIEIRPDVPQTFFALLSILLLLKPDKVGIKTITLSGILLGVSFLFLQKTIFIVAGFGLVQLYWVYIKKWTIAELILFWICFTTSISPYYFYLIATDQFETYLFWNWILNMNFEGSFPTFRTISDSFIYNHFIWIFYIIGVFILIKKGEFELSIISLVLLGSAFIVNMPYRQYFMPFVPLMCIISASSMIAFLKEGKKLRLVVGWAAMIPAIYFVYTLITYPNKPQLNKINWVLITSSSGDHIYDGDIGFNLYRRDVDFFWYSTNPEIGGLKTYQKLENYDYNVYEVIRKYQPVIISTSFIPDLANPAISDHYVQSEEYPDLYIRRD